MGCGMMNYSPLLEEMDFINEKIDTMAFNDIESMKYVVIEKDTFYRVQKFLYNRSPTAHPIFSIAVWKYDFFIFTLKFKAL